MQTADAANAGLSSLKITATYVAIERLRSRRVKREARERRGGQPMMRLRRASVIATLSLLAWAATASAECA